MSSACHSYVPVYHPYVTCMWFYHEPSKKACVMNDFFCRSHIKAKSIVRSDLVYMRHLRATTIRTAQLIQLILTKNRSNQQRCSVKKGVLRNFVKFTGKHLCLSLFFIRVAGQACNFIKKETLAKVFFCQFC